MQEKSFNPFYDFMYGKFLLKDYFDYTIHEDDYVEHAYNIWRTIGNIATMNHAFEFTIDDSCIVKLPCNTEMVEAVSEGQYWSNRYGEDFYLFHADSITMNPNNFLADVLVQNLNSHLNYTQKSQLHADGQFIPFELIGTPGHYSLRFDPRHIGQSGVCIYKGICVDDDGNPLLTFKEAEAIAYKLAFQLTQKQAFMRNPEAAKLLPYIEQKMAIKMAAARTPDYMSENEWNRVLSAQTRHDRKVFWSSYKLLQ